MDRAYLDFERLYSMHQCLAYFVIRKKTNTRFVRLYSNKINKSTGLRCDQVIRLSGFYAKKAYPEKLRRVKYFDIETGKILNFFTNQFTFSALTIAELYRCRWQVEIFFKWIKQHLRIKAFWGTSENAVRIQIYSAIIAFCLVAIIGTTLEIERSTYEILQVLGISLLDKTPVKELFINMNYNDVKEPFYNQLSLNLF